ncbi:MAG: Plug domain-containing protein [Gemmatimonadota bacterium]
MRGVRKAVPIGLSWALVALLPAGAGAVLQTPDPVVVDTVAADPAVADTVSEPFVPRNLLEPASPAPADWRTGVWEWDAEGLQSMRALTLLELLEEVPGIVSLRGGDFGQPSTVTAFGAAGGRVRVFVDGVEVPPLEGAVVDLSRVGLGGVDRVRVERRPGELWVELFPITLVDPRPYTLLEVGTGDLNTNLFRGTFAHPDALGGSVVVSLDRVDTEGPFREEPGASFGVHLRHALHLWDRGGLSWELRRMTSRRPGDLWSPFSINRTDLALNGRFEASPGVLIGGYFKRSWLGADYGRDVSPPEVPELNEDPYSRAGFRVNVEREGWWGGLGAFRGWGGGRPTSGISARAGVTLAGLGGAEASFERQGWELGGGALGGHARLWTEPRFGVSLFAEGHHGDRGIPFWRPPPIEEDPDEDPDGEPEEEPPVEPEPEPGSYSTWTGVRGGAEYRRGDFFVGGALLRVEADSLHGTGLPFEDGGVVTTGGVRTGFEASARIPLTPLLDGLSLTGSLQFWDDLERWQYLPRRSYEGRLRFHDVFMESGNLELWTDIGVRGRDPMTVSLEGTGVPPILPEVPFQQSWFARIQVRVVSVRAFVIWENFTVRDQNQDLPGRLLPPTRALYGVRWTLWN